MTMLRSIALHHRSKLEPPGLCTRNESMPLRRIFWQRGARRSGKESYLTSITGAIFLPLPSLRFPEL
jgi:hypothetical protein